MKKLLLLLCVLTFLGKGKAQSQREKTNSLSIYIPTIWNNSEATFYSLGNRKTPTGKAVSYGVNLNYSKTIYKGLYAMIGAGYFRQSFNIRRPFHFDSPFQPIYSTQFYDYDNILMTVGVGYKKKIGHTAFINFRIDYNRVHSFRQKYTLLNKSDYNTFQVNRKSINMGQMFNASLGIEKYINDKFSIGADLLLPIYTKWNDDEIFFEYEYSNDTQQIARNKSSIGATIAFYYHF
jgi:hypothetical protein